MFLFYFQKFLACNATLSQTFWKDESKTRQFTRESQAIPATSSVYSCKMHVRWYANAKRAGK